MAKLDIIFVVVCFFLVISCKKNSNMSLKIVKYEDDRIFYVLTNNTKKDVKLSISESPTIFMNYKKVNQSEETDTIINPFTINLQSKDILKVSVNLFTNEESNRRFENYPIRKIILSANKTYESYLYLDTSSLKSDLKFLPILKNHKDLNIELLYNGNKLWKNSEIESSEYLNDVIKSENKLIINP